MLTEPVDHDLAKRVVALEREAAALARDVKAARGQVCVCVGVRVCVGGCGCAALTGAHCDPAGLAVDMSCGCLRLCNRSHRHSLYLSALLPERHLPALLFPLPRELLYRYCIRCRAPPPSWRACKARTRPASRALRRLQHLCWRQKGGLSQRWASACQRRGQGAAPSLQAQGQAVERLQAQRRGSGGLDRRSAGRAAALQPPLLLLAPPHPPLRWRQQVPPGQAPGLGVGLGQ